MKTCYKCKKEFPLAQFRNSSFSKDKKHSWCKFCCSAYERDAYLKKLEQKGKVRKNRFEVSNLERREKEKENLLWCSICLQWKAKEDFSKNRCMKNGLNHFCRECSKVKGKEFSQTPEGKFATYKFGAKRRNYSFDLTFEEFKSFWQKSCYYCGKDIKTIGIDRKDNKQGYSLRNCVSCCSFCNSKIKSNMSDIELFKYIKKVYTLHKDLIDKF